jgi:type IV secretory pathway VirB10-like protein
MSILADFPFDSNVIVVLIAVIFTAIKAFLERGKAKEEEFNEEELLEQYEAELRREQEAGEMNPPVLQPQSQDVPPPFPDFVEAPVVAKTAPAAPVRPTLSSAEQKALESFQLRSSGPRKRRASESTKSMVYRHLSSPTAAREALLLSEILGPPKAFKDSQ